MGSLTRKKKSRILLTAVTVSLAVVTILAVSLFSPPVSADNGIELRKIRRLEILGMDGQDPAVINAAREAHTLYSVDVLPGEEIINVVLQLSDVPDYDTYIYPENRLVVDLRNTINLSPTSVFVLEEDDPIQKVRNSQYRVTPSLISRIVLDLEENVTPEISDQEGSLVISVSMSEPVIIKEAIEISEEMAMATEPAIEEAEMLEEEALEKEAAVPSEIVSVPAIEVETEELLVAEAVPEPSEEMLEEEMAPVEEAVEIEEIEELPAIEPAPVIEPAPAVEEPEEMAPVEEAVEIEEIEELPAIEPAPVIEEEPELLMPAAPAPVIPVAALPPVPQPVEAGPEQQLISLTFKDAELLSVLDVLARKGKLNVIAGKDIKGKVTVRLVDVPLNVALNAILNVNGYGYIKSENLIRVLPLKDIGEVINTVTKSFPLSYASASNAKTILQGFITPNGKIQTDDRTNTLIVTDVPTNMERIAKLLPEIDKRVKQVLIEVLIIDSVLGDEADLGVSWALSKTDDNSPVLGDDTFSDEVGVLLPSGVDALNFTFRTVMGDFDLTAFIEALATDSESKVLANPKLLTLNNEKAEIEIIEEFPYRDVTETSAGGQLTNVTFKDIGTKLEVKPQITHDDHVILFLAPEQNSIAGETAIGVPRVDTRKAETTLIIKNHQTVVLGGLRENREVTTVSKVPFLGDLPGVKYIFRSVSSTKTDTELLIFITVHIVESPELLPEEELKAGELANLPRKPNASIELIR